MTGLAGAIALASILLVSVGPGMAGRHTATGTMTAYDATTRTLTVASATGSAVYLVASDARAWLGRRRLPVHELPSHLGVQVTLVWAEADGVKTTHTVRLDAPGGERRR